MNKDELAFWGVVVAAIIAAAGNIIVAIINGRHQSDKDENDSDTKKRQRIRRFHSWIVVIATVLVFSSLASIAYTVWPSRSTDYWFIRANEAFIVLSVPLGIALIISLLVSPSMATRDTGKGRIWIAYISFSICVFLAYSAVTITLTTHLSRTAGLSTSTLLMDYGFSFYEKGEYELALKVSNECSNDFHSSATSIQRSLVGQRFATGEVSSAEKQRIFNNGVLNDVCACYWITGRSAEMLQHADAAREAYQHAAEYTQARVWDPKGFFWSCTADAKDRLGDMR